MHHELFSLSLEGHVYLKTSGFICGNHILILEFLRVYVILSYRKVKYRPLG